MGGDRRAGGVRVGVTLHEPHAESPHAWQQHRQHQAYCHCLRQVHRVLLSNSLLLPAFCRRCCWLWPLRQRAAAPAPPPGFAWAELQHHCQCQQRLQHSCLPDEHQNQSLGCLTKPLQGKGAERMAAGSVAGRVCAARQGCFPCCCRGGACAR